MSDMAAPPRRVTKRDRTRALLLQAASQIIGEIGYERLSLEAVAAKAGMTRGAIYGNFKNKEDLLLAVVAAKWQPILPPLQPGTGFADHMRCIAEAVVAAMPARRAAAIGAASFQLYALTHEAMRVRVAQANAEIYAQMAAGLREFVPASDLPMPAEKFVRVAHAMVDGLMFLHALTPDLIDADIIRAAFELLAKASSAHKCVGTPTKMPLQTKAKGPFDPVTRFG